MKTKGTRKTDVAEPATKIPSGDDRSAKDRILAAAEEEFASLGFDATSVRHIARAADVPMALVAYHFGGKPGLYRAIFEARTPAVVGQRMAGLALADLEQDSDRKLDLIVKSVLVPMLRLRAIEHTSHFGILLAREVSDPRSVERGIIKDMLDPIAEAVTSRLAVALPDRSTAEIHWIYQIIVGTMVYVMADAGRIRRLSNGTADPEDVEGTLEYLLPILLNGIRSRR
ncbi:MAG TPA: CerR family C-terminal domain-containing protein [Dongiaceae bacterium]|nr:CerR family C-terminal domain-containing protein [Dongiaceae bacterium]